MIQNRPAISQKRCAFADQEAALQQGDFAEVPVGTTVGVHRVAIVVMVGSSLSPPGAGGCCNDWSTLTNNVMDGEYLEVTGGDVEFFFDADTTIGEQPTEPGLQCDLLRTIACCNVPNQIFRDWFEDLAK